MKQEHVQRLIVMHVLSGTTARWGLLNHLFAPWAFTALLIQVTPSPVQLDISITGVAFTLWRTVRLVHQDGKQMSDGQMIG